MARYWWGSEPSPYLLYKKLRILYDNSIHYQSIILTMQNLLKKSAGLAIVAGVVLVVGGVWGVYFTYTNVARENIITPSDASIPNTPVRGPLTLMSQAEVIRQHTFESTDGQTYAEMPRQVEKKDANGVVMTGDDGSPLMVANEARNIWVTATTLTTALNLAIISYVFSALIVLFGLISIWTGFVFRALSKMQ
jgi:hypothetical protein